MDRRQQQLAQLKTFTENIDKEVTLLLQNLQWDPKRILEKNPMVVCKHDTNHRIPMHNRDTHEKQCYLIKLGYTKEDTFLPDPVDLDAKTLVKFTKDEIAEIFNYATIVNPLFKRGIGSHGPEPLTVERLQRVYSADERRVIHDAVVNSAPFCHDLADLDLLSSSNDANTSEKKSRLEILAELRNMKRRRTKYRVAAKTRNYSHVLRDVIKSQMDSYGEATRTIIKTEYGLNMYVSQKVSNNTTGHISPHSIVKQEIQSSEPHSYRRTSDNSRDRHRASSREFRYIDDRRGFQRDNYSSKDRNHNYGESDQSERSRDHSSNRSRTREKVNDGEEKGRYKDNYSSRGSSRYVRHRNEGSSDCNEDSRSRSKRYDVNGSTYHKDSVTENRSKTEHNIYIKQERSSQESDTYTNYSRDHYCDRSNSKDKGYRHSKRHHNKKHTHKERNENRNGSSKDTREKYSSDKVINVKQERMSPESGHENNGEGSRKRQRERSGSKDKRRRDYKKERSENHDDRRKHARKMH